MATASKATASDPHIGVAPGRLATVQAFVNTRDMEQGTDELSSPAALGNWLAGAGLADRGSSGQDDLVLALELREALRDVLRAHVRRRRGGAAASARAATPAQPPTVAVQRAAPGLAEIADRLPTRIAAGADGSIQVRPGDSGIRGALAELLLIAATAQTLGTWDRLKICSADDCQWAFYDRSPTRSGCWCSMQVCGSRAKARAYRSRAVAGRPAGAATT